MKKLLFTTNNDWTGFSLRATATIVLFPHGAQKMLGWFNGFGFTNSMNYFTDTVHLPWIMGFLVILIEFFGPMLLLAGLGSRLIATCTILLFNGIIITDQAANGFFMNWFGNQKGEGMEYSLLFIGMSLAILLNGSGKLSVDSLISRYLKGRRSSAL